MLETKEKNVSQIFEKGNYMIDIKKSDDTIERMLLIGSSIEITELPKQGLTVNFGELKINNEEGAK